jgi:hypothetical protein
MTEKPYEISWCGRQYGWYNGKNIEKICKHQVKKISAFKFLSLKRDSGHYRAQVFIKWKFLKYDKIT